MTDAHDAAGPNAPELPPPPDVPAPGPPETDDAAATSAATPRRELWRPGASPAWLSNPVVQCLVAVVVISVFFLLFPGVDPWFTSLFYEPGQGFPVARLGFFVGLRELHSIMTWVIGIVAVLPIIWKFVRPQQPSFIRPRDSLFILGTLAIGPGIIVNGLFKSNWGRPRPYTVDLFGGQNPFVGVWEITDYCNRNCSFISGEGSSAVWLITAAVLVPEKWRPLAVRILLGMGIVFAINRVAFGGHFLSDVLIAWFMTLALIAFAWRLLYENPPAWARDDVLEAQGTRNAEWVHRLFGKVGGNPPPPPPAAP